MKHNPFKSGLLLSAGLALASCTTVGGPSIAVTAQASDSPYFSLSRPGVYKSGSGLVLTGRVCRKSRSTLLSPSAVRVEHLTASGQLAEVAHASVSAIYGKADQACASYTSHVLWSLTEGDTVKVCFDHGHACPIEATVKEVVAAPSVQSP
jgi:hypothetical protein